MMLYICTMFHEYIFDSFNVIERTLYQEIQHFSGTYKPRILGLYDPEKCIKPRILGNMLNFLIFFILMSI